MLRGYLGLGSNLGDRRRHLLQAVDRLATHGVVIERSSSVWETEPIDAGDSLRFFNMVVRVRFHGEPLELLDRLQQIERAGGRVRGRRNAPRPIDLDILWIDGARSNDPCLQLPHPRMWHRAFVLAPLAEIDPELRQPETDRTVRELLDDAIGRVRRLGPLGVTSAMDDAVR